MSSENKKANVITYRPKLRLTQLAGRSGGITREIAIEQAESRLESLRGPSLAAIDVLIAELEDICARMPQGDTSSLGDIRRRSDNIINLAGAFSIACISQIAKNLCDLACAFEERSIDKVEPLNVHVRALRLLSPLSQNKPPHAVAAILDELQKVANYYGVNSQIEEDDWFVEYLDALESDLPGANADED